MPLVVQWSQVYQISQEVLQKRVYQWFRVVLERAVYHGLLVVIVRKSIGVYKKFFVG